MTTTERAPRRDAIDNRAAILDAARLLLNQDPDASLEAIAAAAGLSRRSLYGHFANRDELLRVLLDLGAVRVVDALASVSHADPVVRLALIASRLWGEVETVRVMALFAVRGPFKGHTATRLEPLRTRVRAAVEEGQSSGALRVDLPADRLARLVESAALAVLEESALSPLDAAAGHRLVMLNVLGTVGLGWREAGELIDAHPELDRKDG
ncbi:TetR family transcriptional regulator [Galbitalea soli]|uniref:TetR/AcrR family transcriptional regulator n=1 Tax=Galbitalea soli TaxID=1268042 RepID=A0A7C9TRS2_9MICO|nr:TetR/AcrR family transcriptional regulator [Galbitalea soli]NYJ29264.1 AcrR family transcriptional regulator [Galbitalea soli]